MDMVVDEWVVGRTRGEGRALMKEEEGGDLRVG